MKIKITLAADEVSDLIKKFVEEKTGNLVTGIEYFPQGHLSEKDPSRKEFGPIKFVVACEERPAAIPDKTIDERRIEPGL